MDLKSTDSAEGVHLLEPEWRQKLPSTNSELVRRLAAGEDMVSGHMLAAREQTAGRGRLGHSWTTAPNRDLCFSFVLRTTAPAEQIASLPLAVGLGISYGLDGYGVASGMKWPNDILVGGKKICGILCERVSLRPDFVVAGVGCNVNMGSEDAERIDKPATSLLIETGQTYVIDDVLLRLRQALPIWLEQWRQGGFAAIREAWLARSTPLGSVSRYVCPDRSAMAGRPDSALWVNFCWRRMMET